MLTEEQTQIVDGSLLGDASIWTDYKTPNCKFQKGQSKLDYQGFDKRSYMDWHYTKLVPWSSSVKSGIAKGGFKDDFYEIYTFCTRLDPLWNKVDDRWYVPAENSKSRIKRTKIVPLDLKLTPLALCVWHMDDGSNYAKDANLTLETQGFTEDEVDFLIDRLDIDLGIKSKKKNGMRKGSNKEEQFRIYIGKKSYFDFIDMVKGHVGWECFKYKIDTSDYKKVPQIGENHSRSKISENIVREVFRLRDEGLMQKEIAVNLGLSFTHVGSIINGKTWKHIDGVVKGTSKKKTLLLTLDQKEKIRKLCAEGLFQKVVAEQFKVRQSTVSRIVSNGRS